MVSEYKPIYDLPENLDRYVSGIKITESAEQVIEQILEESEHENPVPVLVCFPRRQQGVRDLHASCYCHYRNRDNHDSRFRHLVNPGQDPGSADHGWWRRTRQV